MTKRKNDVAYFRRLVGKTGEDRVVIFVESDGYSIDLASKSIVHVAIVFDVSGLGPHQAAIYFEQGAAGRNSLQSAYELLQSWMEDHYGDYLRELEEEHGDDAMDMFTANFSGEEFEFSAQDFKKAVSGTPAEKLVEFYDSNEE